MSKKMDSLMKAITKIVKNYADKTECKDLDKNAESMQKEVEEFLKDCGIEDMGVKIACMDMEDVKKLNDRAVRIKEEEKKENREGIVYYLADTGERVHIGDTIIERSRKNEKSKSKKIVITEDNINLYIADGVILKKKRGEKQIPMGMLYYMKKIGNKLHFKVHDVIEFFAWMDINYPIVSVSILLREIALTIDSLYKDNIKNCKSIFYFSFVDGEIHEIPTERVKNFRTIAAFRTRKDAETAKKMIEVVLTELFKSDEEYNKKYHYSKRRGLCE